MKAVKYLKSRIKFKTILLHIIVIPFTILQGCAVVDMVAGNNNKTPHQEFIIMWGRFMGHSIAMVNKFAAENRFLASRKLPNGNIENAYNAKLKGRGDSCIVYYEYEKATRIIVNWRYEGDDVSCVWLP